MASTAQAAIRVVDSAIDVPSAGHTTLREAINGAAAGDTIQFAPTLFAGAVPVTLKLTGTLVVTKSLTITGPGDTASSHLPRLQLEGSGSDRILEIRSPAAVVVSGISFQRGKAAGGGAVLVESGAAATFLACDFVNNQATGKTDGGAILNRGTLILDECLASNNTATNGGALATFGNTQILRSLIEVNSATENGGGVYVNSASLAIESSTLAANIAGTGGGIACFAGGAASTTTLAAITVMDNHADAQSGGLYVEGSGAVANVGGSVFARNAVMNNSGAETPHDFGTQRSGKINSADYNIVVKPGTTLSPYGPNDQIGIDPQLGALAYNGGRTRTYAVTTGSPALERGNPAFSGALVQTDQRKFPRVWPIGGRPDVGAYESGPVVTIALVGDAAIMLPFGTTFTDPGVVINGPSQTILSKTVNGVLNGQVDSCCPGTYDIVYTATYAGYSVSVSRKVTVFESVSLSAPASVTRYLELNTGAATVKLADIVAVTGLPAAGTSCAVHYSVTVSPSNFSQTGLSSLPTYTLGQVGTYSVTVKAFAPCGVELATVTFSLVIDPGNVAWPLAIDLDPKLAPANGKLIGSIQQTLARAGESRWYKFKGLPGSRIDVTLTSLPANFDLVVYGDINQAYNELLGLIAPTASTSDKKLALLGAESAPEAYSPEAYSPEAYSPEAYSPEAYSPEAYSPEAYSPEAYSPEAYSPEAYSPEAYSPEAYSPEAYSPEAYSPEAYSPEAYASAQQRSLVAFSASPGTVSEGIRFSTYSRTGEFYVRVRGQNGVYAPNGLYALTIAIQQDLCAGVTNFNTTALSSPPSVAGAPTSLILWDSTRIGGTSAEKTALAAALASFATVANGLVVDVGSNAPIQSLNLQADQNPYCPIAKNLVAEAIRNLVVAYRKAAPTLADITLVGNDDVIPFFRTNDEAQLASEANYFPPVKDATQSQSSLRYAQVLTQDRYGSSCQVVLSTGPYDLPDLPVGRLVETAAEVSAYLTAYKSLFNGAVSSGGVVPTPHTGFVAGYDFLADSATAMKTEFASGLGAGGTVDALISPQDQPPVYGWTADQLRAAFLGSRHDLAYLAAHFSTGRALAADYTTRIRAKEVSDSAVNLAYSLILSAGCHSGYNTVDRDAITVLTEQPDWAQAFARKNAMWISGTGYQYGDTDFVEYTERLLLEVTRSLRTGSGPISIGRAVVDAKRRYLAATPIMRGIHEKTLLELTLYGLPMVKINLPGARLITPAPLGDVSTPVAVAGGPGSVQGLKVGSLAVTPALTRVDKTLDVVGSTTTVTASYYLGSDGFVVTPGEPVRALESFNVSRPEGFVRGIGFRSGQYTDTSGFAPFTGAPATETRGVHGQFWTDVFYPVRPWNLNQIGEVCDVGGISQLNVFPTQFLSDGVESATGILRRFQQLQFSVFYCPATTETALANPPAINVVASTLGASSTTFSIETAASVGAGVQEVWITYTGLAGSPWFGKWQSLTLTPPIGVGTGIGTWTGTLSLNGVDPSQVRFIVQAVNGIGAVAANTNFGRFFKLGTSTLDGIGVVGTPTTLTFVAPVPANGFYRASVPLSAKLMAGSTPLAGKRVQFRLGPVIKSVLTDANGLATLNLLLNAQPGAYNLEANFAGDATYQNASDTRPFTIIKMPTLMTFTAASLVTNISEVAVILRAQDGTPLKERTVVFILDNGTVRTAAAEITDGAGSARLPSSALAPATYKIAAYFAQPVTLPDGSSLPLSDPLYQGSSASTWATVTAALGFHDEQAWVNYSDPTAPGASPSNLGVSKAEILGVMASDAPGFGPNSILSSPNASRVTAKVSARLSGKIIADGLVTLRIQSNDNTHWRGDAVLNGTSVELNVDWNVSGDLGRYHAWIYPASGSGPLYNTLPALLDFELVLGAGQGEHPAGGISEIGSTSKPWTQETGVSRVRSN